MHPLRWWKNLHQKHKHVEKFAFPNVANPLLKLRLPLKTKKKTEKIKEKNKEKLKKKGKLREKRKNTEKKEKIPTTQLLPIYEKNSFFFAKKKKERK